VSESVSLAVAACVAGGVAVAVSVSPWQPDSMAV
jgi:hypothetical protein